MKSAKNYNRIVVKVGSSVLTGGKTNIVEANLRRIVKHVADLISQGKEVVLVSSGAIACGLSLMGIQKRPTKLSKLQAAAAIGQSMLMNAYRQAFDKHALKCAQILLTRDGFDVREKYNNIKDTMLMLLHIGAIPIVNENDTVSVDEIKFGDNDMLSALVAKLIEADGLEILSDIEGLCKTYDKEKKTWGDLIKKVKKIPDIKVFAGGTDSATCIGGMKSKIEAIKIATKGGIPVVIANGNSDSLTIDFMNPEKSDGTYFEPRSLRHRKSAARKHWIEHVARSKGKIVIDDGAKKAIVEKKASLLSQGVTRIEGEFSKKDVIDVTDTNYRIIATGITNYSSEQLYKIKGKKAEKEVVNRSDLVVREEDE